MIGLLQVDGKYPNLALMHLAAWLHNQDEDVKRILPIEQELCETVYASKVFSYTSTAYVRLDAIRGGTGWDDWRNLPDLPDEAEHAYPAYDLFDCDYAMGFLTRGCIRKCPFCIVPKKEGQVRHHARLSEWWTGQDRIRLLDANLTAHPDVLHYLDELKHSGAAVSFDQGLDARLITPEVATAVAQIRRWGQVHIAWDSMKTEKVTLRGARLLRDALPKGTLMCYVLIGFDSTPEEDLYRVEKLREERIDPFIMPYKRGPYERRFARWVNHKAIWKTVKWQEYARL